ncbi:MAG: MBL fold metallo-hydrolase [Limnochordia bacterium]
MGTNMWVRMGQELLDDISNAAVPPGAVALWYLGQMGFVLKGADTIIYIDPYLVESWTTLPDSGVKVSRRRFPPPFAGDQVRHAHFVLGTHNHSDHINVPTLIGIAASSLTSRFVVPQPHAGVLTTAGIDATRVEGARAFQELHLGGVTVMPIPAAHVTLEQDANGDYTALGYIIHMGGTTIFHAGDTVEYPGFIETLSKQPIDICILPINGRDALRTNKNIIGNMSFREAADVGAAVGAKLIIPGHYDLFAHNSENPAYFTDYLYRAYPAQPYKIMCPGERLLYAP